MSRDPTPWDAFVAASPQASYLQATAWARVKAVNGWSVEHVETAVGRESRVGAQVLLRRPGPARGPVPWLVPWLVPWAFAYAPRGPIAAAWSDSVATVAAWTAAVRNHRWAGRPALLRIDPEIERDGPLDREGAVRAALGAAGWRSSPEIQPTTTRVVDLSADEAALWSDLRKKWRQYVNRARSAGVTVRDAEGDRLGDFHRIMTETSRRTGTPIRTEGAYRDIFEAYHPTGDARLLFAEDTDGGAQAALLLVRCGTRVVEPYGGMTADGAESRANYLLKWEAIRSSKAAGATSYDMWGLVNPGIRQFKAGFGGREITTIGAWELPLDRLGASLYRAGEAIVGRTARRRRESPAPPGDGPAASDPEG
jgi:lipid II:glycine glycyltransferase (peptidoglycan interpeptide bridge formation enzyme)